MSVEYRTSNALLLVSVQSAAGTEASPTPGSNAVRVMEKIDYSPNFENFQPKFVASSVSNSAPLIGGGNVSMKPSTYLSPSSTAGATGDPDWGVLLRGCAMQEVKTASDVSGTSQAVTSTSITLANVGSSGVDNAYLGMVIEGTSGTINGQRQIITGYVGSTKVATVYPGWSGATGTPNYAIRKNSLYSPITVGQSLVTAWGYQHSSVSGNPSRRRRMMDAMGSVKITVTPRQPAKMDFNFTGVLPAIPDDVTRPGAATFLGKDPLPVIGASCYLSGAAAKFNEFTLDLGNGVQQFDDPTSTYGYDSSEVTERDVSGTFVPNLVAIASRNAFNDWLTMTNKSLWICWGATGSGISIWLPSLRYIDNQPDDAKGFQVEKMKYDASGNDAEAYICVF